jgi:hydroxymethylpyrimidine pyrophosphatase-like HAD family hydrolase
MVFGFPSTTAAGIKAISLLHAHGFTVAVNTARTLQEVKQYCRAYGFAGGVAEYGAVVWDGVKDRTIALMGVEARQQLQRVKDSLRQIPGVFLNDDYQHSLRAFTYQEGRTAPLPAALVNDLLLRLGAHRLRVHQTGLDTAVVARDIDKGTGLEALLSLTGLLPSEALAIGDSEPDLAMFRAAGAAFAPGNISCRQEAKLLGCSIAALPYQPGLLQIARKIAHPEGGGCDRCRGVETAWPKNDLFISLLEAADKKPLDLLLRHGLRPSILGAFRK